MKFLKQHAKKIICAVATLFFVINTLYDLNQLGAGSGNNTTLVMLLSGTIIYSGVLFILSLDM